jgi:CRP-like cAMP-binding protein
MTAVARKTALTEPLARIEDTCPLAEKLAGYLRLSNDEREFLRDLHTVRRRLARHRELVVEGRHYDNLFILCSGVMYRYKVLSDGKRQALGVGLPGDLIGFPSCLFEAAVSSVASLTEVEVAPVPFARLFDLFTRHPRLGTALFWSSARETAIDAEHLVDLGRRGACQRLAHLILELLVRLRDVGLADELSCTLPLTQELMADLLGLSTPHVNRMVRALRDEGLATVEDQRLVVHDLASLAAVAGFDARYLVRRPIPGLGMNEV